MMIVGIGCDLVAHDLTERLNWTSELSMLQRVFSNREIELFHEIDSITFLAGRFAAKEAVLKSLGTGMEDGIALSDIEILKLETGQPRIEVKGRVKEIADSLGVKSWKISISHSDRSSMAFVLAEK